MRNLGMSLTFIGLCLLSGGIDAFAHGEDKPGPHGGVIRMPGAFHTEVMPRSDKSIDVYLLDINWADPAVKDSSVSVTHVDEKRRTTLECQPQENHFSCERKASSLKSGYLIVKASRLGIHGVEVQYPLPLLPEATGD